MGNNFCLAFKSQNAGDSAIQKIAVMADDQNRAVIIGNHFLKQFQRFNIQIIRWLIKNQKIMGLGKKLGKQQPVLLATRQGGYALGHFYIIKHEVTKIAGDMFALTGNFDHIASAFAKDRPWRLIAVKGFAPLVKIGRYQAKPLAHAPAIGFGDIQQQSHQR